ncbi:MAG: LPS-assembly protein LptD [Deltaproteobacteria bacterium]|nr:LPS-assembly protein LptD [Deltaproteobacteria bacterium]
MPFLVIVNSQGSFGEELIPTERILGDSKVPWQIAAKSLTYKEKEGAYIAEGEVVISKGDQYLFADKAVYNVKTETAEVSGDVRFESGGDILTGERGEFDLKNQTGKIVKGCLFIRENNFYISGEVMEKVGENTYRIQKCELTTCDGYTAPWSITGADVKVTVEGYGFIKHAAFRARRFPFLYVPYMVFPAKIRRQSGLLPPRAGYSTRNGADVELPFFWAITDRMDATFYQRYMSERGYMQGLEFRYMVNEGSKGIFMFDMIPHDAKDKNMNDSEDVDISPFERDNRTRYWARARADQDLPFGMAARLDVDYVSDQDYLLEFDDKLIGYQARPDLVGESGRPLEEKRSPTRRSALRISRDGEGYSLQALSSYHQRPEDPRDNRTPQPLAGLNFMMLPTGIGKLPIFFSVESDTDYVGPHDGERGHRFSLAPEVRFPFRLGPYIEFEPSFGYTLNSEWYVDDRWDEYQDIIGAYDVRARMMTGVERTYEVNWRRARRLKHRIWPQLSYRYRGLHSDDDGRPWFEATYAEGDINRITLSLANLLDARLEDKKGDVTYRQWATLDLSQSYDIAEARGRGHRWGRREPFMPLSAELIMRPFSNLDFRGGVRWDYYDLAVPDGNVSFKLSVDRAGDRKDKYKITYVYVGDDPEDLRDYDWDIQANLEHSLSASADVNVALGFYLGSSLESDLEDSEIISNSYWLGYQSQCWGAKLLVDMEDDGMSVMVGVNLLGLGDFGTEQKTGE